MFLVSSLDSQVIDNLKNLVSSRVYFVVDPSRQEVDFPSHNLIGFEHYFSDAPQRRRASTEGYA